MNIKQVLILVAVSLALCMSANLQSEESFYEELLIKPLPDGKVYTQFQFTTRLAHSREDSFQHFNLFPKSLGQIVKRFAVDEMHLSFTQGRWWNDKWGYSLLPAPIGVELSARFGSEPTFSFNGTQKQRVDTLWRGLTYTLSGLFCGSLEQMTSTSTSSPLLSFLPEGDSSAFINTTVNNEDTTRYSILPREAVCTENLTPWMKLLPCGSKGGLSALLNSLRLFDVHHHSMGVHIRTICQEESKTGKCTPVIELSQTLAVVFDPKQKNPNKGWSFESLFGLSEVSACPLASESRVYVISETATLPEGLTFSPAATSTNQKEGKEVLTYDLKKLSTLALKVTTAPNKEFKRPTVGKPLVSVPVTVHRYFTGYGQEFGGISVEMTNHHANESIVVSYFEMIPWYLRVYFHTMKVIINGVESDPVSVFSSLRLIPAEPRVTPSIIEFKLELPPSTTTFFVVQFEKAFLHWTEHPPDANRGFDIGSAVVTAHFKRNDLKTSAFQGFEWSPLLYKHQSVKSDIPFRIYTEGLLVSLPTPDFSMPYNVITLTGTIFALFFGSIFNVLIRRMKFLDRVKDDFVSRRPIARILRKVLSFIDDSDDQEASTTATTTTTTTATTTASSTTTLQQD